MPMSGIGSPRSGVTGSPRLSTMPTSTGESFM